MLKRWVKWPRRRLERHELIWLIGGCLGVAILVTFLVGSSRVFLGVHYPTDVLGGWILGFLWASAWWFAERRLEAQSGVAAERDKVDKVDDPRAA